MEPILLALDFGGTKHAAAITTPNSRQWIASKRQLVPPNANAQLDLSVMQALIQELLNGASASAIGVSFGGPVHFATGTVRLSHHVPGWEDFPLQAHLQSTFGAPTSVDNDANVAALGEHQFGAGQGLDSLLYITVSTGIGGGWILNGQPWRGAEAMAGEIGHTVVAPNGPVCLCGKRGCLERLASGPYIATEAKAALAQAMSTTAPESQLQRMLEQNLGQLTAAQVSQAASQGDTIAQAVINHAAWALGVAIGNTANLINPQRFILGGGVTHAGEQFWQQIRHVARATALPEVAIDIMPAALSDEAPLWGAVALAEEALNNSL